MIRCRDRSDSLSQRERGGERENALPLKKNSGGFTLIRPAATFSLREKESGGMRLGKRKMGKGNIQCRTRNVQIPSVPFGDAPASWRVVRPKPSPSIVVLLYSCFFQFFCLTPPQTSISLLLECLLASITVRLSQWESVRGSREIARHRSSLSPNRSPSQIAFGCHRGIARSSCRWSACAARRSKTNLKSPAPPSRCSPPHTWTFLVRCSTFTPPQYRIEYGRFFRLFRRWFCRCC